MAALRAGTQHYVVEWRPIDSQQRAHHGVASQRARGREDRPAVRPVGVFKVHVHPNFLAYLPSWNDRNGIG